MGWRFRKTLRILPGVRLNISKGGISTTLGPRGASINLGHKGVRSTVGLPGSGISHSQMLTSSSVPPSNVGSKNSDGCVKIILAICGLLLVGKCMSSASDTPSPQASAPPPAAAVGSLMSQVPASEAAYVSADSLNGRAEATTKARIVHRFRRGDRVEIVGRENGWVKVAQGGAVLWLLAKHVTSQPPTLRAAAVRPDSGTRTRSAKRERPAKARPLRSFGGDCPCSSQQVCIGPRGGRYCYTSGGNKRYGV